MNVQNVKDISDTTSEAGIIASLIHHPEFAFQSEELLPNHFVDYGNQCFYAAITSLVHQGIMNIDTYNICNELESNDATRKYARDLQPGRIDELIDNSELIYRNTVEEYKNLVSKVVTMALRRDMYIKLGECQQMCGDLNVDDVEHKIYSALDEVLTDYSSVNEIPEFKDVIDDCWAKIKERQQNGYSGIPFKFKTLNEFATIERGELFIFAAEAKQGKSIMLLNCAIDLLKQGYRVLYLDSELSDRLFTGRVIAHLTGIEYRRVTSGAYDKDEEQRIDEAREWMKSKAFTHLYIPMFDIDTIYTAVKKVSHTQGLDVLIVDYFKSTGEGDSFTTYQEMGRFTDIVKNKISGDMNIASIGAVQATQTGRIADSQKIGRNASTIALIQDKTPQEIAEDGEECGNKKLRVILNRNGMQHAPGEYISLQFTGDKILYEEAKQAIPHMPY